MGYVVHYSFDEFVLDGLVQNSGSGSATLNGHPGLGTALGARNALSGFSLAFRNSSAVLTLGAASGTRLDDGWALSAWFKALRTGSGDKVLFSGRNGERLVYVNEGGFLASMAATSNFSVFSPAPSSNYSATSDPLWHMLTAVYANGNVQFFLDGVGVSSVSVQIAAGSVRLSGVGNLVAGGAAFATWLDEVLVYPSALDRDSVAGLYQAGRCREHGYLSYNQPTSINDNDVSSSPNGYPSFVQSYSCLSAFECRVKSLSLTLNRMYHSYIADLDIVLRAPDGTTGIILRRCGESCKFLGDPAVFSFATGTPIPVFSMNAITYTVGIDGRRIINSVYYTFTDCDPGNSNQQRLPPGSIYPTSETRVHSFENALVCRQNDTLGDWQLYVIDAAVEDIGNFSSWSLDLDLECTDQVVPPPPTTTTTTPTPAPTSTTTVTTTTTTSTTTTLPDCSMPNGLSFYYNMTYSDAGRVVFSTVNARGLIATVARPNPTSSSSSSSSSSFSSSSGFSSSQEAAFSASAELTTGFWLGMRALRNAGLVFSGTLFTLGSEWTLSAWIFRIKSGTAGGAATMPANSTRTLFQLGSSVVVGATDNGALGVVAISSSPSGRQRTHYRTNYLIDYEMSQEQWQHIAVVGSASSGSTTFYVDGNPVGDIAETFSTLPLASVGVDISGSGWFSEALDEVGGFSRALSAQEISQLYRAGSHVCLPRQEFICQSSPITVPDFGRGSPYPSSLHVNGVAGTIQSAEIVVNLTLVYPADTTLLVRDPSGTTITLMNQAGGYSDIENAIVRFSDNSGANLIPASQLPSGMYRPTDYDNSGGQSILPLSSLRGHAGNGQWSLFASNGPDSEVGTINDWCVVLSVEPYPQSLAAMDSGDECIYRIAAGRNTPFTDAAGQLWSPDSFFHGTSSAVTAPENAPIAVESYAQAVTAVAMDASIFRAQRVGEDFTYTLPLYPANFSVNLYFVELADQEQVQRSFDVSIGGTTVDTTVDTIDLTTDSDHVRYRGFVKHYLATIAPSATSAAASQGGQGEEPQLALRFFNPSSPTITPDPQAVLSAVAVCRPRNLLCPANTFGTSLYTGCTCDAGYVGAVTPVPNYPFVNNTCTEVPCPPGSTGASVKSGCVCDQGFHGQISAAVGGLGYNGRCVADPSPACLIAGSSVASAVPTCADFYSACPTMPCEFCMFFGEEKE